MNLSIGKNCKKNCYDYMISNNANKSFYIDFYGGKMNFNKFCIQVDYCTRNMLDGGITKGTVVTVCLPNCPQMMIAFYALARLGAVVSMVSPLLSNKQIAEIMKRTDSKILIKSNIFETDAENATVYNVNMSHFMGFLPKLVFSKRAIHNSGIPFERFLTPTSCTAVPYPVDSEVTFGLFHSGGTTGEPKTVMLSQKAINYCAYSISINVNANGVKGGSETCLHVLPLFYGYGLGVMHTEMCNTLNLVLRIKFGAEDALKCLKKHKVALIFGIPVMYRRLMAKKGFNHKNLPQFKCAYTGAESATKESFDYFSKNFGEHACYIEGYGLTECVTAFVACDRANIKLGSCGKPSSIIRIESFNENGVPEPRMTSGEICVSTEAIMLGYFKDEQTTQKVIFEFEGRKWLKTGDFGYVDNDGFVFLIQRIKNIIKRNGINIFPSQVESCIKKLPYVAEVAVFGHKDVGGVERIVAAIALRDKEANVVLQETIKEFVTEEMGIISTPEILLFLEVLPRTTVGKVDIVPLKAMLEK